MGAPFISLYTILPNTCALCPISGGVLMPRYDLRCTECGHVHEACVPVVARHDQTCPLCAGDCKPVLHPSPRVWKCEEPSHK